VSGGPHLDLICSVLSELLANAIDHGLLELDSKLKEDADGFFVYYQAREEKLEQLSQDAYLSIQFDYQPERTLLAIGKASDLQCKKRCRKCVSSSQNWRE